MQMEASKIASDTDINWRLELTAGMQQLIGSFPPNVFSVELPFTDWSGLQWTFRYHRRLEGNPRPSLRGEWLKFVKFKGVRVGDAVIIRRLDGGELIIEVKRKTNVRLFGGNMRAPVEDAHRYGVA